MNEGNKTTVYQGTMDSNIALTNIPYLLKLNAQSVNFNQLKAFVAYPKQMIEMVVPQSYKWEVREPTTGDHIRVRRNRMYHHHGVYIGNGRVIHFSGTGSEISAGGRVIVEDSIADFAKDGVVMVLNVPPDKRLSLETILARAKSRLGETDYNLIDNNCEHFASWCVEDKPISKQVKRACKVLLAILAGAFFGFSVMHSKKKMKENKSSYEIAE